MVKRSDVARLAGVSPAVVSYVLNNGPRQVSPSTRQRVLDAVETLDYSPNALASSLRRGSTRTVGLIMPSPMNPYIAEIADRLEKKTAEKRHVMQICISRLDIDLDVQNLNALIDHQVDGIIMLSATSLDSYKKANRSGKPVVVIDHIDDLDLNLASSIRVDNELEAKLAVDHLLANNHRKIACITGPVEVPTSNERLAGWKASLMHAGLAADESSVFRAQYTAEGGWNATKRMLDNSVSLPTAIFVASDAQAQGVISALTESGISVPEEISIISFDGSTASLYTSPPLTVVRQPIADIVELGLSELFRRIAEPESKTQHKIAKCNIIERGSVRLL